MLLSYSLHRTVCKQNTGNTPVLGSSSAAQGSEVRVTAFLGVSTRGLILVKAPGKWGSLIVFSVHLNSEITVRGQVSW